MLQHHPYDDRLFPLIFEHSIEGILVTNLRGEIVSANPSCLEIFGYQDTELIGQTIEKLIPVDLRGVHEDHRKSYFKSPRSRKMYAGLELRGLKKNGETIPLEISLSFVDSQIGRLVICFIVDISSRKELEIALRSQQELVQQYLDVTNTVFLVLDKQERIFMINKAGADMLGLPEKELVGRNWFDEFIPESQRDEIRSLFNQIVREETKALKFYENEILSKSGEIRLIEWHNTVVRNPDGGLMATLSSGIDITEKRKLEEARTNAILEGQENERRRIAQELHDGLGQSISAISLNLNALEPELERFNEKFRRIYANLKGRLTETMEEVRAISHNLTPRILEDFGLERALEHMCDTIDQSTPIELNLSVNGQLSGLEHKVAIGLYRIIQELVNNALRHAKPSMVNVSLSRNENETLVIVEDDGIGIDLSPEVVGLGLSNVKARAELLKGEIHIDSNPKSGTTVSISIPA